MIDATSRIDRRRATVKLVVVTIFIFVTACFGVGYFAYRGVQSTTAQFRVRDFTTAAYWRDEILFSQRVRPEADLTSIGGDNGPNQIMAINLRTGSLREMGIEMPEPILKIVTDGDRVWVVCQSEIVELDDSNVIRSYPESFVSDAKKELSRPSRRRDIHPILMNHGLAAIARDKNGRNRLYTFEKGEWQAGRQFASPGSGRSWAFDHEKNQIRLVPNTTTEVAPVQNVYFDEVFEPSRNDSESLTAFQSGDEIHLVSICQSLQNHKSDDPELVRTMSYRNGFDFVTDEDDVASALQPENDLPDTTGWRLLDPDRIDEWQIPIKLAIVVAPELFVRTRSPSNLDDCGIYLVQHPSSTEIYLIAERFFQSCRVLKRVGDRFEPFPFSFAGLLEPWRANDAWVVLLALGTLALTHVVLLAGAHRLAVKWKPDCHSFGHRVVVLAPLSRRWCARGIDLFVQWGPLIAMFIWGFAVSNHVESMRSSPTGFAYSLLVNILHRTGIPMLPTLSLPGPIRDHGLDYFCLACAWVVLFAMATAITQGRLGLTLGKWICGIRVVRTTLRPSGFARSLLRELLMCVDTFNLLSPIPAVVAVLMSSKRQRIGDLWADTIVIVDSSQDQTGQKRLNF